LWIFYLYVFEVPLAFFRIIFPETF
jgi:hypothetical protein